MDEILSQVKALSGDEIRAKLIELGEKVGPIQSTTKSLFERKLAKKLFALQHPDDDSEVVAAASTPEFDEVSKDHSNSTVKNEALTSSCNVQSEDLPSVYYGVCLPADVKRDGVEDQELTFSDKTEALKFLKKYPGARFKVFKSQIDAKRFSLLSADDICPSPRKPSNSNGGLAVDGITTSPIGISVESCPYKGPKVQQLVELMKAIERGDCRAVEDLVWDNPRYLISSGDTPVILKEGPRYNALHVAALKNQPAVCQLILDTLEDPDYIDKMYGHTNETETTRSQRIGFLVDLYLNTPDKGACESPLHFACKFGFKDVVAVLSSHPKTDRYIRNKFGETPKEVICSRCSGNNDELKIEIKELLEDHDRVLYFRNLPLIDHLMALLPVLRDGGHLDTIRHLGQYYVPLVRSEDNTTQPMIGRPWSPDGSKSPLNVPIGSWNPKDPLMAVKACAGPMTPSRAESFHRRWTTPPSGSPKHVKRKFVMTKREDSDKGLERIGRELAHDMKVPWIEYWDFLQTYVDLSTDDGLELLEEYLQKQSVALCLAEGMEILTNSFHSSDQQRRFGEDKNPWKMMESIQEMAESDDVIMSAGCENIALDDENIPPELRRLDKMLSNGTTNKMKDVMQSSFDGREFDLTKAYPYCYDQHYYDRSLDSSWTQEDLSSALSPISCLTALFAKLSILDRSQRMRMRPGGCLSCMGGPKHVRDRDFHERKTENIVLSSSPVLHYSKSENDATQSKSQKCFEEIGNEINRSISCPNSTVTVSENVTVDNAKLNSDSEEKEVSFEKQFSDKLSLNSSDSFKTCPDFQDSDLSSQNWEEANSNMDILFEMNNSKMKESDLEELFEALSERKSAEHKIIEKEKSSKVGRDIVLDLKDAEISKDSLIFADLAIIPVNSSVGEMKLFARIPFKIVSGENIPFDELDIPNSPSVINIKFNFGSGNELKNAIPALAIHNYVKGKTFFVSGYQPTKSDLDVYRAIDGLEIDDRFTLVKKWKTGVLSYLTDSTFSWKSPAKVKPRSRLSASFPQVSTPRLPGESPVIFYHSPVVSSPKPKISETWSMSNIKAQLFSD